MKKVTFILVGLIGLSQLALAQTESGKWLGGGNMSMSIARAGSNSTFQNPSFGFSVSPRVGYFILNRWALGLVMPVGYSRNQRDTGSGSFINTANSFGASVFTRYYVRAARFSPFLQGEFGYSRINLTTRSQSQTIVRDSEDRGNYALGAGLAYFVTPQVAIEGTVEYANRAFNPISANHTLDFRVGVMMYLGKGK